MVAVRSQAMMLRIILCITFCWTLANAYSSTYIIVSPNAVRPGLPLNVSVSILKAPAPVAVTCTLVKDNVDITSQTGTFQAGKPGTILVQVPTSATSGSYSLRVVGSGGLRFRNESQLAYKSKGMSIFVQTDKAIYKPGQIVRLRALAVYPDLKTFNGPMTVEIYDSLKNKIKRWVNLQEPSGVVAADLPLSEQPPLGNWKIKVTVAGQTEEKQFSVDEYVLPKFEVTVNLPSFMLTTDRQLKGSVSAKYTYGKAVEGTGVVKLKLDHYYWRYNGPREIVKHLTLVDGKADFTEDVALLEKMYTYGLSYRKVIVEAQVTETLTGITLNGTAETKFHTTPYKIEIPTSNPKSFKPGLRYTGFVKVSLQDGRPIVGARPKLQIDTRVQYPEVIPDGVTTTTPRYYWGVYPRYTYKNEPTQVLEVPDDGFVHFNMDVPKRASEVSFTVKYGSQSRYHSADAFKSPSDSFLQVLLKTLSPQAGSNAEFEVKSTEQVKEVVYQILARGNIVSTKRVTVDAAKPLQVAITPEMAPKSKMVIYYVRSDGEVVADSLNFNVKGAFKNQVSLQFDKTKAEPGQKVSVSLSADPGSFVGLLAVDQSVLLLKSGNDITQEEVLGELDTYDTRKESFYGWGGRPVIGRKKRSIWWYPIPIGGTDAHDMFQNTGVVVLSDTMLYQHKEPVILRRHKSRTGGWRRRFRFRMRMARPSIRLKVNSVAKPGVTTARPKNKGANPEPRIRRIFPETWLWINATTGTTGTAALSTIVPDTITSWVASAFAVHSVSGLGLAADTAKLEAFRPFFVSLNLPYSVVRGEELILQAVVFNYMDQDMDVLVTLDKSNEFKNIVLDKMGKATTVSETQTERVMVQAGKGSSVFFPIIPSALGKIDILVKAQSPVAADGVQRQLIVEAEGVPQEYNQAAMIDLTSKSTFSKTFQIELPSNLVQGTTQIQASVIGDLMGPALADIDSLLKMPYGCGEQNMLHFAPDVFISKYLTETNQFVGEIESKAISYMEKGYQKELTYQHYDGSFSAFGNRDSSGSMWLTAFVVKSFHQARGLIFIDDELLTKAINWMIRKQNIDGSFPEPGRVLHKAMQGGSSSGVSLTAYVVIALLENKDLPNSQRITSATASAVSYLENQVTSMSDPYGLSIVTYALQLANSKKADDAFQKLDALATLEGGSKYWKQPEVAKPAGRYRNTYERQPKANNVEMSAYALLIYAERKDLAGGLPVLKWLISQRNAHGGFASTQDTVMAMQALSMFAAKIYTGSGQNMQVTVASEGSTRTLSVDKTNAIILQTLPLPSSTKQVAVSATGSGMALFQVSVSYNIDKVEQEPSFAVEVSLLKESQNSLTVKVCSRWLENSPASGMAVKEIGIPSGFEADLESISQLPTLKKTENAFRKIVVYLDEISAQSTCITFNAQRVAQVAKAQPVAVRVYDYYSPDNQITVFYQSKVLTDTTVCDVCGQNCEICKKGK